MNLSDFKTLLREHPYHQFRLQLAEGRPVPASFHVTEVGRVEKTFIDCGGTLRNTVSCQLQVWVGEDEDHRLQAGKTAQILEKAASFLDDETLPVEIEYEDRVISQYSIGRYVVHRDSVDLHLSPKHTDCLAREVCVPLQPSALGVAGASCCGPNSGCC